MTSFCLYFVRRSDGTLWFFSQVGLRDYQDTKADVILKYSADEARNLKSYGEFPETVKINETVTFGEDGIDDDIEFDDVESSEEEGDGLGQGIDDIWEVSAGQKPVTPKNLNFVAVGVKRLMSRFHMRKVQPKLAVRANLWN